MNILTVDLIRLKAQRTAPKHFLRNLTKQIVQFLLRQGYSQRFLRLINLRLWALRIKRCPHYLQKLSASDWCAGDTSQPFGFFPGSAWADDGHLVSPK